MDYREIEVRSILTRSSGYLRAVTSHSLNPYRGCSLGRSLCGVGCYVQHNPYVVQGRRWGHFLEVKANAAACYRREVGREQRWARRQGDFSIFMASSTDPYLPQERSCRISRSVLDAMLEEPPDQLTVQTHSCLVLDDAERLQGLSRLCRVRVHISIESDQDRLPGLPAPAFSVEQRLQAALSLRRRGIWTVATLSPLLPVQEPERFFQRLGECVDAVVLDHFVGGDGSRLGARTRRTALPAAMESAQPGSSQAGYRDLVESWARRWFPGPIGVGPQGFAGR